MPIAAGPVGNTGSNHQPNVDVSRLSVDDRIRTVYLVLDAQAYQAPAYGAEGRAIPCSCQRLVLRRFRRSLSQAPTSAIGLVLSCSHRAIKVLHLAVILGAKDDVPVT